MKKYRLFRINYKSLTSRLIFLKIKTIAVLLFLVITCSASVFSQVTVSVSFENTPLGHVLKIIEQKSRYRFIYSNDVVPVKKEITLSARNEDLSALLTKVLEGTNIEYRIMQNKVITLSEKKTEEVKQKEAVQNFVFSGKVVDRTDMPLPGATVKLLTEKELAAITNRDGEFRFPDVPSGRYTIKINFLGYETYQTEINIANSIGQQVFVLKANEYSLQEVVVVGYGESKRKDLIGSVARVTANEIAKQPVNNLLSALQGIVPGLEISNQSGTPGSPVSVRIRGINSINAGSPLILVDNVPADLTSVAPSDVESVEILKDASSTAIYGARGSNGVILITTKRGKTGRGQISVQAYNSLTSPTKLAPVLSADQYLMIRKEAYKNDDITYTALTAPDLFMDNTINTNWGDELYRTALAQDYQLNFSGGSNEINYFFSGGLRDENSTIKGDWYNRRYNLRTGIDARLSKRLKAGGGIGYTYSKNNTYSGAIAAAIYYALPVIPFQSSNGKENLTAYSPYINPNRQLTSYNRSTGNQLLGNVYMDYNIWDKLNFRTDVSFNNNSGKNSSFTPSTSSIAEDGSNSGSYGYSDGLTINIEPKLNYEKTFGNHNLKTLVGGTYLNTSGSTTNISTSTPSNAMDELNTIVAGTVGFRTYSEEPYKFASVFGRINYKIQDRYLLEAVARRDGSSRFGPENKFGTFWSIGGAYILSEEPIFRSFFGEDIFIKIRSSYGTTGTDGIGAFRYIATSPVALSPYMNNTTIIVGNLANPALKWEETKKFNVGADINLFKDRISIVADYYKSQTNGMLYSDFLSLVTGFSSIIRNMPGIVDNSGYELNLNLVPFIDKKVNWTTSFNISFIKNKLVSLPALANATFGAKYLYKEGSPLDLIWGFNYQGVDPQTGLAKFEDVDGNGGITSFTPDYQVIGKRLPDFFGGWNNMVSYENFDLTVNSQFVKGILKNYNIYAGIGDVYNLPTSVLARWQQTGDITDVPRAAAPGTMAATNNSKINQSNFAFDDASYFRVKNITLGYTFSAKKLGFSNLRAYATGYNLFTISKFKGDDPEGNSNVVPMLKTYTMGLNLTF
jgi:TonB-dependent starch-binding outer membrane protein SusC